MARGRLWLLIGAMLGVQQVGAFQAELVDLVEQRGKSDAYHWLIAQEDSHRQDVAYYDWRSRFAMDLGDYKGAIPALRRLIDLEPAHMGARLDLVLALQLAGRSFEARNELQSLNRLLRGVEVPDRAARQLAELNSLLLRGAPPERVWLGEVRAAAGYDSNANRGSEKDVIIVNLGGIPAAWRLAPENLKTGDEFAQAELHLEYGQKGTVCHLHGCTRWLLGGMVREYGKLGDYDQRHLYLGYQHQFVGRLRPEISVVVSNIEISEPELAGTAIDRYDNQNSLLAEYRQRLPWASDLSSAVSLEVIDEADRDLPVSSRVEAELRGLLRWPWDRSFAATNRRLLWTAAASYHHRPEYSHGDAERVRMTLAYPLVLTDKVGLVANVSYQVRRDLEMYHPYFGGARREDREWLLGADIEYRLASSWTVSGSAWYEQTDSTIPLFDVNRLQFKLNLGYAF